MEDCENIAFDDIKDTVIRHLTKLRERFSDYFPDLDIHTVSWVVDPFKCKIAEAILELRSNTEARIQFEGKANLSSFWMSKAAKAFKIAHEKAVKKLLPRPKKLVW